MFKNNRSNNSILTEKTAVFILVVIVAITIGVIAIKTFDKGLDTVNKVNNSRNEQLKQIEAMLK